MHCLESKVAGYKEGSTGNIAQQSLQTRRKDGQGFGAANIKAARAHTVAFNRSCMLLHAASASTLYSPTVTTYHVADFFCDVFLGITYNTPYSLHSWA